MIKRFTKYFQLPWPDRLLLIHIFILMGIVRFLILMIPFRYLATYLGKGMQESPVTEIRERDFVRKTSRAIELMSRYTPWESKCLVQAITGKVLLRQRRLQNTLYLGVAKDQDKLIAHAWLRCGEDVVTGGWHCEKFTIVRKFADISEGM